MRGHHAFAVFASLLLLASHGAAADGAPPDPAAAATSIVDEIRSAAASARTALRIARAQRDVIKTLCLNDKLTQLDVTLRRANERREELIASAARRDDAAVGQERARLDVHRDQARRVAAEAQQCVGTPDPLVDSLSGVSMTEPPLPSPASYPGPEDVFVTIQPPLAVSAYK